MALISQLLKAFNKQKEMYDLKDSLDQLFELFC